MQHKLRQILGKYTSSVSNDNFLHSSIYPTVPKSKMKEQQNELEKLRGKMSKSQNMFYKARGS